MSFKPGALPALLVLLASSRALAAPQDTPAQKVAPPPSLEAPPGPLEEAEVPQYLPRLILDTGRPVVRRAEPDLIRFTLHGEYQARYQAERSFPLVPAASAINANLARGQLTQDSIGQNQFVAHWLRITPRLQIKDRIELIGQMDVLTGLIAGETAHDTSADQTPRDSYNGSSNVQPRWLYADFRTDIGLIRVGQQPSHWGLGILANDGDHPSVFGDYRYGNIVERLLFATKPGGKDSDVTVAVAGDLVYRDNTARLTDGDHAFQGVLAAFYERGPNEIGVYGVYRKQTNDKSSGSSIYSYTDELEVAVLDVFGKFAVPVPGNDAFLFGGAEAAAILGSTNMLRTLDQALDSSKTSVRSYGGATQIGVVHQSSGRKGVFSNRGGERIPFGDVVGQIEVGYASGDADPYDGTERRFVFDPNHKVGLLLFDEVLRWQTARASTAAQDPLLANSQRPTPGANLLPSNGGVYGAEYINPTVIIRPRPWLDLKGGMVIAQSTADVVDPYRVAVSGSYVNSQGGDPKKKDLGVELDLGTEGRFPLDHGMTATLGAQGGVLFPGNALANAAGERLNTQWITVGRLGLLF